MNTKQSSLDSRITAYDEGYVTCSETYAKLMFYTDEQISVSEVTSYLGVQPTYVQSLGDKIINSLGRERTAKSSLWVLSSENFIISKDLRHHIDWIIKCFQNKEKKF